MNKHRGWEICSQLFLASFSSAYYTIKTDFDPENNYYHVTYQLKTLNGLSEEKGILKENIRALNPEVNKNCLKSVYLIDHIYNSYSIHYADSLDFLYSSGPTIISQSLTNKSFDNSENIDFDPIPFYMASIRSGLKTTFKGINTCWQSYLDNNQHTYLDNSKNLKNDFPLKANYWIKNIRCIENTNVNLYTIAWNANETYKKAHQGEIKITSEGVLESLFVKLPRQIQNFNMKDENLLNQPTTLTIEKISKENYEKIFYNLM